MEASSSSVKALNTIVASLLEMMKKSGTIHGFTKANKASLMGFVPESIDRPTKKRTTPLWKIDFANLSERWSLIGAIRNGLAEFGFDALIEMVDDNKLLTLDVMWYQQTRISAGVWVEFEAKRLVELDGPTMITNCQVELNCDCVAGVVEDKAFIVPSLEPSVHDSGTEMAFARSAPITKFHWHAEPSLDFGCSTESANGTDMLDDAAVTSTAKCEALINGGSLLNVQSVDEKTGLPIVLSDATPISAISIIIESSGCGNDDESVPPLSPSSQPPYIKQLVYVDTSSGDRSRRQSTLEYFRSCGYALVAVSSEKECLEHWRNALVLSCPEVIHGPGSFTNQWRWLIARAAVSSGRTQVTIQDRSVNPRRPADLVQNEGQVAKFLPDSPCSSYGYGNSWLSTFMTFGRSSTSQVTLSRKTQNIPGTGTDAEVISASVYGTCDIDVCHYEKVKNKKLIYYDVASLHNYYCAGRCGGDSDLLSKAVDVMATTGLCEFVLACASASQITMDDVFKRGPQFAFTRSVCVHAYSQGLIIEPEEKQLTPKEGMSTYTGAHVFESLPGVWTSPMLEFDFASFFTSIILSTGLCFSELVVPFTIDDNGNVFVCEHWRYPPDFDSTLCTLYGRVDKDGAERSAFFSHRRSSAKTWKFVDGGHTFHFMDPGSSADAADRSLSFHMLEEFASRRAQCRRIMENMKADPSLYNAQTSTWISRRAKLAYDSTSKLGDAFKLTGNATYGGFASLGRFRCVAVSAATTDLARLLLQDAAKRVVGEWSLFLSTVKNDKNDSLFQRLSVETSASLLVTQGSSRVASGVADFCKRHYSEERNPFGMVLVQGDSDAFHICVTCIQPRGEDGALSPAQLSLAEDVGLSIQDWISDVVLTGQYHLPRINMAFKQLAYPTIITTAKKRYAAKVWNIGESALRDFSWRSTTVLKSFDEKMDIPPVVQHAITGAVEDILVNCGASSVEQIQRVARAPLRQAVLTLKSALQSERPSLDVICQSLVPFTKFQRYSRSTSLTANGKQTSPARIAAFQMLNDTGVAPYAFSVGDRVGFVVENDKAYRALRHIHASSRSGSVVVSKCPNGHALCTMRVKRGGSGQDVNAIPLPSIGHYEELISNQLGPLISLLGHSPKVNSESGFSSSSFFGKLSSSADASSSIPSIIQCGGANCGVLSSTSPSAAKKDVTTKRTTPASAASSSSTKEKSTEPRKNVPFFYMLKKR
jgi:DNA polymerase elongation subunit (family B)